MVHSHDCFNAGCGRCNTAHDADSSWSRMTCASFLSSGDAASMDCCTDATSASCSSLVAEPASAAERGAVSFPTRLLLQAGEAQCPPSDPAVGEVLGQARMMRGVLTTGSRMVNDRSSICS